jgi:hypothetical protein
MKTMIEQIKQLLQNVEVAETIKSVTNQVEAIKVLVAAGEKKGYQLTVDAVSKILIGLTSTELSELSEEDLLAVSGGMKAAETWGSACGNSTNGHTCCWHCYEG